MKAVLERSEVNITTTARPDSGKWSIVIPAAGMGTRLRYERPKILYPIAGQPILFHLLDTLGSLACRVVVIGSPSGAPMIQRFLVSHPMRSRVTVCVQEAPHGMAHAIWCAREHVQTEHALVVWGDQVTVRERTARMCMLAHDGRPGATLTLPTFMRRDPYIHFVRDAAGRIVQVQQRREGEISVPVGENDCGMFLFKSARLFEVIGDHMSKNVATGAQTGEFNLLPLLPLFDDGNGSTQTLRIADEDETLGVNTQDEASAAERVLASRKMGAAHV